MPTGDPVPSAPAISPRSGKQPSDAAPQPPPPKTSPEAGHRIAITPMSAAITARNNYVSPYKQTPRSVSSPSVRANSAANAGSPNFKDIVTRFNTKSDEKIPVPTNRIPANVAAANSLKNRKPQPWKPNGTDTRKTDATPKPRSSSVASVRSTKQPTKQSTKQPIRPSSAAAGKGSNPSATGNRATTNSRQARPRKPSNSSTASDNPINNKLLPSLQTSFAKGKTKARTHRRSRSMEAHSPSAASLADNESDDTSYSDGRSLHHRRSRSNIESSSSPDTEMRLDPDLLREFALDPSVPILPNPTIIQPSSSSVQQSKKKYSVPLVTSSHGSRHPPQPSKSPQLTAYISALPPKTSPQLRSTKGNRLPPAASPTSHASRQRLQPGKDSSYQRGRDKSLAAEEGRRKEPKKNIPELGTIDFAARRARIQNAFTKSVKENNERELRTSRSSQSLREGGNGNNGKGNTGKKGMVQGRIEEEREEVHAVAAAVVMEEAESGTGGDTDFDSMAEQIMAQIPAPLETVVERVIEVDIKTKVEREADKPMPGAWESETMDNDSDYITEIDLPAVGHHGNSVQKRNYQDAGDNDSDYITEIESVQSGSPEQSPTDHGKNIVETTLNQDPVSAAIEVPEADIDYTPSPPRSTRFSQFFMPDQYPYTAKRNRRPHSGASDNTRDLSSRTSIAVVVTPDSPTRPPLAQITDMSKATSVGWSTDSDDSPDHQPTLAEMPMLSPIVYSAVSDDRRTLNSFYSRYDDHGDEIVSSYTETGAGSPLETFRRHQQPHDRYDEGDSTERPLHLNVSEDDCTSLTSCSATTPLSARPPSDIEQSEDGWVTSSDLSPDSDCAPSAVDHPESPTTPRQVIEPESPPPPTPPPKDLPPKPPRKDYPVLSVYRSSSTLQGTLIPGIETNFEPLGLAIQSLPAHYDLQPSTDRMSSYNSEHYYSRQSLDQRPSFDSRSSLDHRPSTDQYPHRHSPPSSISDSRRSSTFAPNGQQRYSETPPASMMASTAERTSSSIHSEEPNVKDTPEQKMLKRRRHLMKEIVDTESAFFRDMTVAEEIYKGSANACYSITPDDIKVLFGNTDAIVQFSKGFLEVLKLSVSSVYVLRRGPSGINSRAPSIANSVNSDERLDDNLTDEEKDFKTYVGEAFAEVMYKMEKVYGDYCKNHEIGLNRLAQLESVSGVAIWLQECKACAEDLTNAWNLESLLIKPVQRVLKYPLLLSQLLECTPLQHPDRAALEIASREMTFAAGRINEMKKRKDMVQNIVSRKRNESDIRHGITKGFARRAEKLRQSVGLSEVVKDETFNRLFENYNMHCAQVEVVARDIEIYAAEIQGHVEKFIHFSRAFRDFATAVQTPTQYMGMEVKWKKFDSMMREISTTYLQEHKLRVKKHAIDPLETLLKLHQSPQIIMSKRNKKAVDYARYKAIKDRGDIPDKRTQELADTYLALNETLIEELPRLFILTKRLVDAVLFNFIDLQAQWMNDWASKIKMTFMDFETPHMLEEIVRAFAGTTTYNETILQRLTICNGSLNAMQFPSAPAAALAAQPATALAVDGFERAFGRPRTADDSSRDRSLSLNSHSPVIGSFEQSERRHSGGASLSPLLSGSPPVLPLPPHLNSRMRASSATTVPMRLAMAPPQQQRVYSAALDPYTVAASQTATFFPERWPSSASSRPGYTAGAPAPLMLSARRAEAPSPSPPLPSAAFSSAMPMDDDRDRDSSNGSSRAPSRGSQRDQQRLESLRRALTISHNDKAIFIAASLYEFKLPSPRREAGFPYLNYEQGEIFDVIGVKGEIWLARNQDDASGEIGWIWCKHFTKVPEN